MSVINQMLRDLDKRQAPDAAVLRQPVVVTKTWPRWLWGLWLLVPLWLGIHYSAVLTALFSAAPAGSLPVATGAPSEASLPALPQPPATSQSPGTASSPAPAAVPSGTAAAVIPAVPAPATPDTAAKEPVATLNAAADTTRLHPDRPTPMHTASVAVDAEPASTDNFDAGHSEANTVEPDPIEAEPAGSGMTAADASEAFAMAPETRVAEPATATTPPQMRITVSDPALAEPQHLQAKALQAQARGQWREAEAAWVELIRLQPHAPAGYAALAQLYLQQQQPERLEQVLLQARQQQAESVLLQWTQVQALAARQQWTAMLQALTPAIQQQYPQPALALEAHAAQQLGQAERALQAYRRWTLLAPQDSRAWLGLAVQLEQSRQWPQAQQAYQQALQLGGLTDASRQFIQQRLAQNPQS